MNKFSSILLMVFCICLACSILIDFFLDKKDIKGKKHEKYSLKSLEENFYFMVVSFLTIGYGDMHPSTEKAKRFMSGIYILTYSFWLYYLSS